MRCTRRRVRRTRSEYGGLGGRCGGLGGGFGDKVKGSEE